MHRDIPAIPCCEGAHEEARIMNDGICCDPQVKPQASPIHIAKGIRKNLPLVDQQATTADEHRPSLITTDIEESTLRDLQPAQARKRIYLEVRRQLEGAEQGFPWRRHTCELYRAAWGHQCAPDYLDIATNHRQGFALRDLECAALDGDRRRSTPQKPEGSRGCHGERALPT